MDRLPPDPAISAAPAAAGRTVGRHLAYFAAALGLPILAVVGLLLWQVATTEQARLERDAVDAARSAATAVDRELIGLGATLEVLALSHELREGDLAGFHLQAREVQDRLGLVVVLRARNGQQLLNTRLPWGTPLPRANMAEPDPATWASGRPVVSGLFIGAVAQAPLFTVQLPLDRIVGRPESLTLSLPVERIRELLREEAVPPGWALAVVDRAGLIIARNNRHAEFVGRPATTDLQQATQRSGGTWHGQTIDGIQVLGAYAVSRQSGWRIVVGVPAAELDAPLRRTLATLAGMTGLLLALGGLLALGFARGLARPLRALARDAAALGRGEAVAPRGTRLREISVIAMELAEASARARAREAELQQLNASLEDRVAERTEALSATNARLLAEAAERGQVEAQLRQAQKMEAVGRLTGGVAHDFNNLLTVVIGNLALVRRQLAGQMTERLQRAINGADEGAKRAAELTRRLLAFSRQQPLAPEAVDVNRLVADMSDLLRRTIAEDVQIETVLAGGLWRAQADPNQLESAILNLAVNARDAMPGGGRLTIETGNTYLDEAYAASREEVRAGQYVMVSVSDTGTGMAPEVVAKAFEPFFTTKPVGKGTGLGLSQVYGFAKQSGGHASIYSEPGQGTTVKLYLPRVREQGPGRASIVPGYATAEAPAERTGRGETILVVEDERLVREFAAAALEEAGYRVLVAEEGPAALELLEAHPEVALLFTDVVLAGPMNGRLLADAVAARRPELRVLFTTGYTRNAIIHHGRLDDGVALLNKPYTGAALAAKVRQKLDAGPKR